MKRALACLLTSAILGAAGASLAADATPMAEDPAVEARLVVISEELRCLVCQNESLADSRAPLALDLKREIRQKMEQGDSDALTPVNGSMRLINSDAVAPVVGYPLANGYIDAISLTPAATDGLVPVEPPELSEGNHFSYALQWFAFTVIGVIGIGVLVRADLRDRKKAKAAREKAGTSPDEAVDEEPSTPAPHEVG